MTEAAHEAAEWMVASLERAGVLEQHVAAHELQRRFGDSCVYVNNSGNLALATKVLQAFRAMTKGRVVWESGSRQWRWRERQDRAGRRVDE